MTSELAMSSEQAESVQFVRELGDFCDNDIVKYILYNISSII